MPVRLLILAVVLLCAGVVFSAPVSAETGSAWSIRCEEGETGRVEHCEIFQRLIIEETGQRLAEMAIGYPKGRDTARGVVILPLGIILQDGIRMRIDSGAAFSFKVRYCVKEGCYAFIDMHDAVLDRFRRGLEAQVSFETVNGENVDLPFSLRGFTRHLREISSEGHLY